MGFHPYLQESVQSGTESTLSFQVGRSHDMGSKEVLQLDSWQTLRYDLIRYELEGKNWSKETSSSTILHSSLLYNTLLSTKESTSFFSTLSSHFKKWQASKKEAFAVAWGPLYSSSTLTTEQGNNVIEVLGNWLTSTSSSYVPKKAILNEISDFVTDFHPAYAYSLEYLYTFRKPMRVQEFLKVNAFLIPLLTEAFPYIREYFPNSELYLEVVVDPEEIDEEQLVIFIATNLDVDRATDKLDQFDDVWWLDALEKAQGKLCITLEFQ